MSGRTLRPIVTGQSVLAVRYSDGVMMAADTQLCYGNQKKFKDISRLFSVQQSKTLVGFSGEYSDVQFILKLIEELETADFVEPTRVSKTASDLFGYLSRVLYNRRTRLNPLWNQIIVAGTKPSGGITAPGDRNTGTSPFLGYVDFHGTTYEDDVIATGFGSYFALPLLRKKARPDMSYAEAKALLEESMRILFARDCKGYNRIQIATVTSEGASVEEPYIIHPKWDHAAFINPTSAAELCSASW